MSIEATRTPVHPEPSAVITRTKSFTGGYGMEAERQVGQPLWTVLADLGQHDADGITIREIKPEFGVNSSDAAVEYIICELDQQAFEASGYESFGYGMHANRLDNFCARTRPAEGADFGLRADKHEELLVGVTPTRPGRTVVKTHRISFDAGWQRGSDVIDVEIEIVTPQAH